MYVTKNQMKQVNSVAKALVGVAVVLASLTAMPARAGMLECKTGGNASVLAANLAKAGGAVSAPHKLMQMAADCGHTDAQYRTGIWYLDKENPNKDAQLAANYLRMAKYQGHAGASTSLGLIEGGVPNQLIVWRARLVDGK